MCILGSAFFLTASKATAQITRRALFLGNSYTGVNNLPQLVHDLAASAGDNLIFDSNSPGGYTLADHSLDATSQGKIMAGGWDYVVMQGQSQEPIAWSSQFTNGASALYNQVRQSNSCAVVMPYMTWGRKNGDATLCPNIPVMCAYQGMDSVLKLRYLTLASSINGEVAPVSVVWKYLRQNHPGIELYQADESHPSAAGSYAAACCFYAGIFKKDPTLITFNYGLPAGDAAAIRNAAKIQVYNNLSLWDYKRLPVANIHFQAGAGVNEVNFHAPNQGVTQTTFWDFGDGATSTSPYTTHSYAANGTYTVSLTTGNCNLQGTYSSFSDTVIQFCNHTPTVYTSQAWLCNYDTLWTQAADSYQWFAAEVALPETNRYVADYSRYATSALSVRSTVNSCSELSGIQTQSTESSGYYFDGIGDPCMGDTVKFAVLHTNGFLSGAETILWFKNDLLLASMNDEDSLLIAAPGKYECKVVNSTTHCPLDTTYFLIEYACEIVSGTEEKDRQLSWSVFPNPASEIISIQFTNSLAKEQIGMYNATGRLVKIMEVSGKAVFSITDLPNGLYFIRINNSNQAPFKLIKQ